MLRRVKFEVSHPLVLDPNTPGVPYIVSLKRGSIQYKKLTRASRDNLYCWGALNFTKLVNHQRGLSRPTGLMLTKISKKWAQVFEYGRL